MQDKLLSVLLGGTIVGIASTLIAKIPFLGGCLACLSYIGAGLLAVWHYTSTQQCTLSGGQGALLGLQSGAAAALISGLLTLFLIRVGFFADPIAMLETSGQLDQMSPQQAELVVRLTKIFSGFWGIVFGMLIGGIFGLFGGILGAATFKKGASETPSSESDVL
jgi:hypothetical protein